MTYVSNALCDATVFCLRFYVAPPVRAHTNLLRCRNPSRHFYPIVGMCVQHTEPSLTRFSIDNLERISQSLGKVGGIHIGHEATVIAISALGAKTHHAFPVLVFAGCKAPNPQQQRLALTVVSIKGGVYPTQRNFDTINDRKNRQNQARVQVPH